MVVDGGMVTLDVLEKAGPDVRCKVADPGIILSRANLTFRRDGRTVRARNSMLPVLSSKVGTPRFGYPLTFPYAEAVFLEGYLSSSRFSLCWPLHTFCNTTLS